MIKIDVGITIIVTVMLVFVLLGIILSSGKGASLIAGYNTMSEEEKANYDEKALSKFVGKLMFAISFALLFMLIGILYEVNWGFAISVILIIVFTVSSVIYLNTSPRFRK